MRDRRAREWLSPSHGPEIALGARGVCGGQAVARRTRGPLGRPTVGERMAGRWLGQGQAIRRPARVAIAWASGLAGPGVDDLIVDSE